MVQEDIKKFEPFWGKWYIVERLGGGSYGDVYKVKREEYGEVYYSALKVMSIPRDKTELNEASLACGTIEKTMTYFDNIRQNIVKEINLMERLKGKTNIVSYEDHDILPKNGGKDPGYDIFIRMELLEDLQSVAARDISLFRDNREIVKIGKDMGSALSLCHAQNIIHRDIKMGNIFRSIDGDYKLGDFGIARSFNDSNLTMSVKGTFDYMAPEVYNREHYDFRADIYSLGILLYNMLNGFRGPFLPQTEGVLTTMQKEEALIRRMQGEELPRPRFAYGKLADIVLKACAFSPNNRFATIEEFNEALAGLAEEDFRRSEEAGYQSSNDGETSQVTVQLQEEEATVMLVTEDDATVALGAFSADTEDDDDFDKTVFIPAMQVQKEEDERIAQEERERALAEEKAAEEKRQRKIVAEKAVEEERQRKLAEEKAKAEKKQVQENKRAEKQGERSNGKGKVIAIAAVAGLAVVVGLAALMGGSDKENEEQKETTVEVVEDIPEVIVYKPVCVEEMSFEAVEPGKTLGEIELKGTFQQSAEDAIIVEGTLEWDDKAAVLEKSEEFSWTFTPNDTETYEVVHGTTGITVLCLDELKGIDAVEAIEDKKALVDVDLSNCELENLDILKGAENLKYVSLDGNNITSIEILKKCPKLQFISLVDNKDLSDITPILELENLQAVFLDGTNVSSEDVKKVQSILNE